MKIKNNFMFLLSIFSLMGFAANSYASPLERVHCDGHSEKHRVLVDINSIASGQSFYEFTFKDIVTNKKTIQAVIVGQTPVHGRSYSVLTSKTKQLDFLSMALNREVAELSYQLVGQVGEKAELECYGFFAIEGFAP